MANCSPLFAVVALLFSAQSHAQSVPESDCTFLNTFGSGIWRTDKLPTISSACITLYNIGVAQGSEARTAALCDPIKVLTQMTVEYCNEKPFSLTTCTFGDKCYDNPREAPA